MLIDAWKPVWGGGQVHVQEIAKVLIEKYGYDVDVVIPNLGKVDDTYLISLGPRFVFPNILGRVIFAFYTLIYVLTHEYDVYHSHSFSTALFLPLVRLFPGRKIYFTLHGAGVTLAGGGLLNKLGITDFLSRVVLYQYPYDGLMTAAEGSIVPGYREKAVVVGNGVDVAAFGKVRVKKEKNIFKVLWVGRDDPVKGVEYLERAMVAVRRRFPAAKLVLVKDKYGAQLIREYKSSDVFVLPSLSEGLPLVLLEAMAARLPVVATNVGDVSRVVMDGVNGYLVPAGNSSELARKIIKVISDKGRGAMGALGRELVCKQFTWEKVAEKTRGVYLAKSREDRGRDNPSNL